MADARKVVRFRYENDGFWSTESTSIGLARLASNPALKSPQQRRPVSVSFKGG